MHYKVILFSGNWMCKQAIGVSGCCFLKYVKPDGGDGRAGETQCACSMLAPFKINYTTVGVSPGPNLRTFE